MRKRVESRQSPREGATEAEKQAEALRLGLARYRFLADAMPQIVWTARPDGDLDYYNERWYEYTGLTFDQTKGWGWEAVLHPDDLPGAVARWKASVETGEAYEVKYRFRRASDGAYRWHLGRALPLRNVHGDVIQWVGTCTDIDDRERAEQALRESEAKQRALLKAIPDIMFRLSRKGVFLEFIAENEGDLAAPPGQFLGKSVHEIMPPEVAERTMVCLARAWQTREMELFTYDLPSGNETRHYEARIVVSGEEEALAIVRDITERKRAEEALRESVVRQRAFLRDVLGSVTEGRLRLCDDDGDLPAPLTPAGDPLPLSASELRTLRRRVQEAAAANGFPDARGYDLMSAVSEAAMNAVVHAGSGEARICADGDTVQVWIQDHGKGIAMDYLHRATLERGYTTAGTMGHGFWLMLKTCDRIWLLTGPTGTTVVLEQERQEPEPGWFQDTPRLPRGGGA